MDFPRYIWDNQNQTHLQVKLKLNLESLGFLYIQKGIACCSSPLTYCTVYVGLFFTQKLLQDQSQLTLTLIFTQKNQTNTSDLCECSIHLRENNSSCETLLMHLYKLTEAKQTQLINYANMDNCLIMTADECICFNNLFMAWMLEVFSEQLLPFPIS